MARGPPARRCSPVSNPPIPPLPLPVLHVVVPLSQGKGFGLWDLTPTEQQEVGKQAGKRQAMLKAHLLLLLGISRSSIHLLLPETLQPKLEHTARCQRAQTTRPQRAAPGLVTSTLADPETCSAQEGTREETGWKGRTKWVCGDSPPSLGPRRQLKVHQRSQARWLQSLNQSGAKIWCFLQEICLKGPRRKNYMCVCNCSLNLTWIRSSGIYHPLFQFSR